MVSFAKSFIGPLASSAVERDSFMIELEMFTLSACVVVSYHRSHDKV